jgi:hypothetical protein
VSFSLSDKHNQLQKKPWKTNFQNQQYLKETSEKILLQKHYKRKVKYIENGKKYSTSPSVINN